MTQIKRREKEFNETKSVFLKSILKFDSLWPDWSGKRERMYK